MTKSVSISYLFENAKSGDFVGFWKPGLMSYIIKYTQIFDKSTPVQLNKINHVGVMYVHSKTNKELILKISHQTAHGGKFDTWKIEKNTISSGEHSFYSIYANTSYKKLYIKFFDDSLSEEGNRQGIKDATNQIGKKYGFGWFSFGFPFTSKILGKILNIFLGKKRTFDSKRICTIHNFINAFKSQRFGSEKVLISNPVPTPEFAMTYNEDGFKGELCEIIDFEKCLFRTY